MAALRSATLRAPPLGEGASFFFSELVGVRGFEPPAPASRMRCETRSVSRAYRLIQEKTFTSYLVGYAPITRICVLTIDYIGGHMHVGLPQ